MFGIPNPYLIGASAVAAVAFTASVFFYGEHVQKTTDQVAIDRQKLDAAKLLQTATDLVRTRETEYSKTKDEAEKNDAAMQAIIDDAYGRLVHAAGNGLHDKAGRCGSSSPNAVPSNTGGKRTGGAEAAGCTLSVKTSVDLLSLARDADEVTKIARACQADRAALTTK